MNMPLRSCTNQVVLLGADLRQAPRILTSGEHEFDPTALGNGAPRATRLMAWSFVILQMRCPYWLAGCVWFPRGGDLRESAWAVRVISTSISSRVFTRLMGVAPATWRRAGPPMIRPYVHRA